MTITSNPRNYYTYADQNRNDGIISILLIPILILVVIEYLRGNLVINAIGLLLFIYFLSAISYNIIKFYNMNYEYEKNNEIRLHEFQNRIALNKVLNSRVDKWGNRIN